MKFSTTRESLLQPLQQTVGAVERRQTSPILGNLLIEAIAGGIVDPGDTPDVGESRTHREGLLVTATDSEITLRAFVSMEIEQPGRVTVPARKLYEIVRQLSESARIDFEIQENRVRLRSGRSRFTLSTLPAEQFPVRPVIDDGQRLTMKAAALLRCIRRTAFSMAQQDVRFYLNGMKLEIDAGRLATIATDGHRLAYSSCDIDHAPGQSIEAILPRKSVLELQRLLAGLEDDELIAFELDDRQLQVDLDDVTLNTKLIDGKFPEYRRVIPTDGDKTFVIDCATLRQSLSRAMILSNEKYRGIRLALQDSQLTLSTNNPEQEEAIDELEIDYSGDGTEIGFNVTYLLDVLNALPTESARFVLKDAASSALMTPDDSDDSRYVVMPMRL